MKVIFAVCAESVSVDQQTNKLSILGIIEELSGAGFPGIIPSLSFIFVAQREKGDPETISYEIKISHNGKAMGDVPTNFSFQGRPRTRAISNIQGIPIPGPGVLTIAATRKNKKFCSWSIPINDVSQPALSTSSTGVGASSSSKTVVTKKKKAIRKKVRR